MYREQMWHWDVEWTQLPKDIGKGSGEVTNASLGVVRSQKFLNSWNTVSFQEGYEKRKEFMKKTRGEGVDKGAGFDCFLDLLSNTT